MLQALTKIEIPHQTPSYNGKVRDIYDLGDKLLLVTSDRVSAFDVVFSEGIPNKGCVLNSISMRWFSTFASQFKNHVITCNVSEYPAPFCEQKELLENRSVLVHKAKRIDYECIVRGYILGSAWKSYQKDGSIFGLTMSEGLSLGDKLEEPLFTPTTKADEGHDENITFEEMSNDLGVDLAEQLKAISIDIYNKAAQKLESAGIILCDTKFEFGVIDGEIAIIDELLTPDSSRYCIKEEWEKSIARGKVPDSFDKQFIRNYLETLDWDKSPPAPKLPDSILLETLDRYKFLEDKIKCII